MQALYWATSEWSAREIEEAYRMLLPSCVKYARTELMFRCCGQAQAYPADCRTMSAPVSIFSV